MDSKTWVSWRTFVSVMSYVRLRTQLAQAIPRYPNFVMITMSGYVVT